MIYLMIISIPDGENSRGGFLLGGKRMETEKSIKQKNKDDTNMQDNETLTVDELARQIYSLEGQEFFMSIPIGGEEHGR